MTWLALALGGWASLTACAGSASPTPSGSGHADPAGTRPSVPTSGPAAGPGTVSGGHPHPRGGRPVALVTSERENQLLALSLPGGRVIRRIRLAPDPTTVAAGPGGPVVAVSPGSGAVTLLSWPGLRPQAVLRGFRSPQLAAPTPDGEWVLVSDAAAGAVSSIELANHRVVDRVWVGSGAHHLAVSPDMRTAWVALGEAADTIVVLDSSHPAHLRVIRRLHPAVAAHDLAFSPDGRTAWVTSAAASYVSVLDARSGRLLGTVAAGAPPQHIAFTAGARPRAYITSGYGSSIEMVDPRTLRVERRTGLPYGSFNLAAAGNTLVTTSLLTGQVTVLDARTLARRMTTTVAPNARAVAILTR